MRRLLFIIVFGLTVFQRADAAEIRMVGTDLLGPDFVRGINEWAERNHLSVSIKLEGSRLGQDALRAHEAELGLLVFAPDEARPQAPFIFKPWAYEIAVIAVSARVPLTQLSYAQLGGIFGASGQVDVRLWGDLGAAGEWATRPVSPYALTTVGAGGAGGVALELFSWAVLENSGRALKSNVGLSNDSRELVGKLSAEEGSIAILPEAPVNASGLKVLPIARGASDPAYPPSAENIDAGDYPLRLAVYLVVAREALATVRPLLNFLCSDEAVPLATQARLVSLPAGSRAKLAQEFAAP